MVDVFIAMIDYCTAGWLCMSGIWRFPKMEAPPNSRSLTGMEIGIDWIDELHLQEGPTVVVVALCNGYMMDTMVVSIVVPNHGTMGYNYRGDTIDSNDNGTMWLLSWGYNDNVMGIIDGYMVISPDFHHGYHLDSFFAQICIGNTVLTMFDGIHGQSQ